MLLLVGLLLTSMIVSLISGLRVKKLVNLFLTNSRRKRDDNKNKICAFQGGWAGGQGGKLSKTLFFHGKRHDNKNLKVKMLLSRNFVVMALAPKLVRISLRLFGDCFS